MAIIILTVLVILLSIGLLLAAIVIVCQRNKSKGWAAFTMAEKEAAYNERNKSARRGAVVFIGDSITDMYPTDKFYEGYDVINRGIGSDKVDGVLARLQSNVLDIEPRAVVLMIGTNDLDNANAPEHIHNKIVVITERIKSVLPQTKVYIESIYPITRLGIVDYFNTKFRTNDIIDSINNKLKEYCTESGMATFIDVNSAIKGSDGRLVAEYTTEGLHINETGYAVITDVIKPVVFSCVD